MHCPDCGSDDITEHNEGSCVCNECNCHFKSDESLDEDAAFDA